MRRSAGLDDDRIPVQIRDVDTTGGGNWRGVDVLDPVQAKGARLVASRLRIDARKYSLVVRQEIQPTVVNERRGNIRRAADATPGDAVGAGNVAQDLYLLDVLTLSIPAEYKDLAEMSTRAAKRLIDEHVAKYDL